MTIFFSDYYLFFLNLDRCEEKSISHDKNKNILNIHLSLRNIYRKKIKVKKKWECWKERLPL
jgi:hypothetical protein